MILGLFLVLFVSLWLISHARNSGRQTPPRSPIPRPSRAARACLPQDFPRPPERRAPQQEKRPVGRVRRLPQLRDRRRPPLSRLEPFRQAGTPLYPSLHGRGRPALLRPPR